MSTSGEELHELQETAEHARHSGMAGVSFTMSLLAVLLATTTLMGHRSHTEEIVLQNQATDQWNYYQAKNQRRYASETAKDLASLAPGAAAAGMVSKYDKAAERYRTDSEEIRKQAEHIVEEQKLVTRRAARYDLGEVLLEIALVISSLMLLTGKRLFWAVGLLFGAAGVAVALTALLLH